MSQTILRQAGVADDRAEGPAAPVGREADLSPADPASAPPGDPPRTDPRRAPVDEAGPDPLADVLATVPPESTVTREVRLARIRRIVALLIVLLVAALVYELLQGPLSPIDLAEAAFVAALGLALIAHHQVTSDAASRRIARDASLTRILQGLSRSVSPESIVEAIVQELRTTAGADHVVIARVRRPDHVVEVTLVSARTAVPSSRTYLRPELPGDQPKERPGGADGSGVSRDGDAFGEAVADAAPRDRASGRAADEVALREAAEEIGLRVRSGYGLSNLLVEPLAHERRFVGALILSRRTRLPWSDDDRRLLVWAAGEVSAAFGRAYAHEEATRGANIDPLTGLPNRRYFDELSAILRPGRRAGDRTGMVMVDVDRFKRLNDRYGHQTGDRVLRAIAGAITASVRAEDTPARFGGEEFAVILRRASAGQAADVGERIRAAVAAIPYEPFGLDEPVTVSVGVTIAAENETEVRPLIERADRALYVAKRRGRNRVEQA
ncbi:MAG: two-component system, cell cycle response regulator [Chloroflexota bacterium]|nr:two-component system, cell cycle response regulator [Chloroflexota bacterium]